MAYQHLGAHFKVALPKLAPTEPFFPRQQIPVIGRKPDGVSLGLVALRWGLIPNYYSDTKQLPQPFNARSETIDRLPEFRDSFRHKRCLIPADQFFEWTVAKPKVRYRCRLASRELFGIAAIWDVWEDGPIRIHSCSMVTTTANELIGTFHNRMPVILRAEDHDTWLDPDTSVDRLKALLQPYPAELMAIEPAVRLPKNAVSKTARETC